MSKKVPAPKTIVNRRKLVRSLPDHVSGIEAMQIYRKLEEAQKAAEIAKLERAKERAEKKAQKEAEDEKKRAAREQKMQLVRLKKSQQEYEKKKRQERKRKAEEEKVAKTEEEKVAKKGKQRKRANPGKRSRKQMQSTQMGSPSADADNMSGKEPATIHATTQVKCLIWIHVSFCFSAF
jgi:hypothetical protein